MKEEAIKEFISNIDFKSNNWKLSDIKNEMRKFLGEEPAIDIHYIKDAVILEGSTKASIVEKVNKIDIVFTNIDGKFKKLEFYINEV